MLKPDIDVGNSIKQATYSQNGFRKHFRGGFRIVFQVNIGIL